MHIKKICLLLLLAGLLSPSPLLCAGMQPVLKQRVGVPPFQILQDIVANSQAELPEARQSEDRLAPNITWLADCDARITPRHILDSPGRKIYTVRNLANQLSLSLGEVDYGVRHLHSPVLLITGNTDNEAIALFQNGYGHLEQSIRAALDHLHPAWRDLEQEEKKQWSAAEQKRRLIEANVDYQVALAVERYRDRISQGRLVVVGSILDLTDLYGRGKENLLIININGERDEKKLKTMRVLRTLEPGLLDRVGRTPRDRDQGRTETGRETGDGRGDTARPRR